MSDPIPSGRVGDDETLARFVMFQNWIRQDGTVRPDAFIPPKDLHLSMTRHIGLTATEIWRVGENVADQRAIELFGRADLTVRDVSSVGLTTQSAAFPENPNHAHVIGWPPDKPSQKSLAQQLAAMSVYVPKP